MVGRIELERPTIQRQKARTANIGFASGAVNGFVRKFGVKNPARTQSREPLPASLKKKTQAVLNRKQVK